MRKEHDFLGEKLVPDEVYYGVQTMRAMENFQITGAQLDPDFIQSMAVVKKASCLTNLKTGRMDPVIGDAIIRAADEIIEGKLLDQFPLDPIQGGAGTSANMNANEVIANRAIEILGGQKGDYSIVHPNDHVNMAQSTNDVFPSAGKLTAIRLTGELLEALDSEQNHAFRDHFLEIPLDLSQVMFITTANSLDTIPRPLLDRMEVIQLSSYTDEEKLQIAKNHLLPKQMKEHGLKKGSLRIDEETLRAIIRDYTRESGVRQLERRLAAVCRKTDMQLLSKTVKRVTVTEKDLPKLLDMQPYPPTVHVEQEEIGVVNGLAWTEAGGEILEVEVNVMEGSGKLELTGNLGDVMKESPQAALSCLRSRAEALGIDPDFYKTKDIHVHFPEGAVPKDGPSAGIAMATALLSALTNRKIKAGIAMTGEVTLRGRVLPIGGLKEKTMAAMRHGIHTVVIPEDNVRDLEEIDQTVRRALTFVPAKTVDTVLETALNRPQEAAPALLSPIPETAIRKRKPKPGIQQ